MKRILTVAAALALAACGGQAPNDEGAEMARTERPAEAKTGQAVRTIPAGWPDLASPPATPAYAALEGRVRRFVEDGDAKGIAAVLIRDGEVLSASKAGEARAGEPIAWDTIYRIYSMTKPVTGVAMMMLWEEGAFGLDDPVTTVLPELEGLRVLSGDGTVPVDAPPTIRQLMNHTAGFAYGLAGDDPANAAFRDRALLASPDLETFVGRVAEVPLLFQPGERWSYSASVDLQGAIVERLSGMSFGEFLDARIFTPLGMEDTGFFVPEADLPRLGAVYGYHPVSKEMVPLPQPRFAYREDTVAMESGGGGLVSTLSDYARFAQMLIGEGALGETRLLKPETVRLMRTDTLRPDQNVDISGTLSEEQSQAIGFGLDFGVVREADVLAPGVPAGVYYWGGAAGTWFWIDPENDLAFIGMIQRFRQNGPEVSFFGETAREVYEAVDG